MFNYIKGGLNPPFFVDNILPFDKVWYMKLPEYVNKAGEQIDLWVKVLTRPNLRSGMHEMFIYRGKSILENIFDKKKIDTKTKQIDIYYPENWCNIPELQALVDWIPHFYPNVEKVNIETHSVYIIQTVRSKQIGIYDDPTEYPQTNKPEEYLAPSPAAFEGLWANGKRIN